MVPMLTMKDNKKQSEIMNRKMTIAPQAMMNQNRKRAAKEAKKS